MGKLTFLALVLALVAVCNPAVAGAADEVNLTGTWEVTIEINGQQGMPVFELKQDGEKLTGKYKGQFGEADVAGTVKDKELEFTFELQEGAKVTYKGTVEKDGTLKGTANYADQAEGKWTAKKKDE